MRERLFNVFIYGNETHVHSMSYCEYKSEGSYDDLTNFLKSRVHDDYKSAKITTLNQPIEWDTFYSMERLGAVTNTLRNDGIMDEDDIYCITHIIDGNVRVDEVVDTNPPNAIPDYLSIYMTANGFDFPQLIEDDYYAAIKILWNEKKYISSMKLLFSAIDTLGFIEYGPRRNSFILWLDEYCDLRSINVTSQEVWELRNSLLHMTNLDSHKVRNSTVERLLPAIAHPDVKTLPMEGNTRRFHASRFIAVLLPKAIEKWLRTYIQGNGNIVQFIQRYDTIVSEARMTVHRLKGDDCK